jgi:ketosteroid isomerase-like protein
MSQENIEIVRSILEPFKGIDVASIDLDDDGLREALGPAYSPDFELRTLDTGIGLGVDEVYRGRDGLVQYLRVWLEPFSEYQIEPLDYVENGDCVLVPTRQWGTGSASGARVELQITFLYELRDGQITRLVQYDTPEEALEAAGLRE